MMPTRRIWDVHFEIHRPLESLPQPVELAEQETSDPRHHWRGIQRVHRNETQFCHTLEGEGVFYDDAGEHRVPSGKGFLAKHSDVSCSYRYPSDSTDVWHFIWLSFRGPLVDAVVDDIVNHYGHVFTLSNDRGVIPRLRSYRSFKDALCQMTALSGARLVMDLLTSLGQNENAIFDSTNSPLVRQAQESIVGNLRNAYGIADVASELAVSREHLARVFRKETGKTLRHYQLQKRMQLASRLLENRELSVQDVAYELGYRQQSNFTRAFKIWTGITPVEYRGTR